MTRKTGLLFAPIVLVCAIVLVACAPRQAAPDSHAATFAGEMSSVELPTWAIDMDCSSCHTAEVQSESDTTTAYFHHAGQQGVRCGTCHVDNDGALMKAHEDYGTAKVPVKLKKTEVSSEVCLDCHNAGALKTETESTTILTDSKGTVVNPHDLPVNDDHARNVTCSSCHKMHGSDPVIETAPKACLTCHHEDVYECGTCHRV